VRPWCKARRLAPAQPTRQEPRAPDRPDALAARHVSLVRRAARGHDRRSRRKTRQRQGAEHVERPERTVPHTTSERTSCAPVRTRDAMSTSGPQARRLTPALAICGGSSRHSLDGLRNTPLTVPNAAARRAARVAAIVFPTTVHPPDEYRTTESTSRTRRLRAPRASYLQPTNRGHGSSEARREAGTRGGPITLHRRADAVGLPAPGQAG
jgi:hypothetical protein